MDRKPSSMMMKTTLETDQQTQTTTAVKSIENDKPKQLKLDNLSGEKKPKQQNQNVLNRRLAGINWMNAPSPSTAAAVLNQPQRKENRIKKFNRFIQQNRNSTMSMGQLADAFLADEEIKKNPINPNNEEQIEKRKKKKKKKAAVSGSGNLTKCLAIDCEMVGVGQMGKDHMLARVSIVNQLGDVILDKFVLAQQKVIDYRTAISGIRPADLANGEDFDKVQKEVADIIKDRIIVGHSLSHDFKVLHLTHPKALIRDTSKYRPLRRFTRRRSSPSLKSLAKIILDIEIQTGEHDSVEDARTVMNIYLEFANDWEQHSK